MKLKKKTSHRTNQRAYFPCNQLILPTSFAAICLCIPKIKILEVWKPIIFTISPFDFPSLLPKGKKNHLEYIVVFNSIEIPWLLVSLWSILLDLVVYMRNDRPSQHTNLSFSCVPTWIKWHVKPSKYVNPKQYVRKWMHWWSRIANQIKNPFNHFNRTTLHYTSYTMALHLSSPLSLLIIKMSLILPFKFEYPLFSC